MEFSRIQCALHHLLLMISLSFGMLMPPTNPTHDIDYKRLIYKHCPNHTSTAPDPPSPLILSTLFQELLAQSSNSRFFETSAGDERTAISGLFQCRGDLGNDECHRCVENFEEVLKNLCGESIPSARIQLSGCYMRYQPDGLETFSLQDFSVLRFQPLHKSCSRLRAGISRFGELREAAFAALENGVISGNGFCDMDYEKMRVKAQCLGNLEVCDCGECVNSAVQIANEECGYSAAGEIYLDGCYISYSYNHNGINGDLYEEKHDGEGSNKLAAIAVGGIVALILIVVFFQFMRSCAKKKEDW